jgi:DNA polymerase III epsilon subunit-like protein
VVLYWRPIVPGWNDQPDTMRNVLQVGHDSDAIVFTGYYHKEQNAAYLRGLGVDVPYDENFNRRKVLPADLDGRVITAWRESGIPAPLFRKTSCGVSAAHQMADYNGHWGIRELCDICPAAQIQRCHDAHHTPSPGELDQVLADLGYQTDYLIEDGYIWTHGLGEQRRYAIQHALGFQIWELDQPHLLHAHGRALTGYQPPGQEVPMTSWTQASLIALDLEGTGAQDRDNEAILEIALVPITHGQPNLENAYATMINPGRAVPRRPWISPGLTTKTLVSAPSLEKVGPELASRLNGRIVVGHNVGVDWRLLNRRWPGIQIDTLLDTLRLARRLQPKAKSNSLSALLDRYQLTDTVTALAPGSQPHRALWDATGTALLLAALIGDLPRGQPTISQLRETAELAANTSEQRRTQQPTLLDI